MVCHWLTVLFSTVITSCRVCFQETENSAGCGGARDTCSAWGSPQVNETLPEWSDPFLDDTNDKNGGCTYQWRLKCKAKPTTVAPAPGASVQRQIDVINEELKTGKKSTLYTQ